MTLIKSRAKEDISRMQNGFFFNIKGGWEDILRPTKKLKD